jgi:predicted nuclease with RNAse H fold
MSAQPPQSSHVVGIDLSGPANANATAVAAFRIQGEKLTLVEWAVGDGDGLILERIRQWTSEGSVTVGIDAPLSYNDGGGDRPGDKRLRAAIVDKGLRPGTVMPPTLNRMVYLTVRGIVVARLLQTLEPCPLIVEVHPSATLVLRGAPVQQLLSYKQDEQTRTELLTWLECHGVEGVATIHCPTDHLVAACASALAAWKWATGQLVWVQRADPPLHPFDFAC